MWSLQGALPFDLKLSQPSRNLFCSHRVRDRHRLALTLRGLRPCEEGTKVSMYSALMHTGWYKGGKQMSGCEQQISWVFKVRRFKQELHTLSHFTGKDTEAQKGYAWGRSSHRKHGWPACLLHPAVSPSLLSTMREWSKILNQSVKGESFRKLTFIIVNTHQRGHQIS